MINTALRAHLIANAGVLAITGTRVYPVKLPQSPVFPCISYQMLAQPRVHTMEGTSFPNSMFQVDAWANSYLQVLALADAITACLDGFRGVLGSGGDTHSVSAILQKARQDFYESESLAGEFRICLDFSVWHV